VSLTRQDATPPRVLVTGWFSFEQMGASAGDLLARDLVCTWLREAGHDFDIATAPPFQGGIDWRSADPTGYSHLVFVCGPIGNGPPVDAMLERFADTRMVGVNLTMLQPLEEWNPFFLLLERDSSRTARPDLVFLSDAPRVPVVGLVLIDAQPEYKHDQRDKIDQVIHDFIGTREMSVVRIDTRLDENRTGLRTPGEVESLIAKMDLVITTRLHGTVMSIKNAVPVIAIDAVHGGAKITRQVQALDWPVHLSAEQVSLETLARAFDYCLTEGARIAAASCRERAVNLLGNVRGEFLEAFHDNGARPR
jgi:hypothetical protein